MPDRAVSNLNLCFYDAEVRGDVWGNQVCAKSIPRVCMQMCSAKRPSISLLGVRKGFLGDFQWDKAIPFFTCKHGHFFLFFVT